MVTTAKHVVFWTGAIPKRCEWCDSPITTEFIDGRSTQGPWGIMCEDCHSQIGVRLGMGNGQRYQKTLIDGSYVWKKVEG